MNLDSRNTGCVNWDKGWEDLAILPASANRSIRGKVYALPIRKLAQPRTSQQKKP